MRKQSLVLWCCGILVMFLGCQGANRGIEVVLSEGVEFPEQIAGKWKASGAKDFWAFQFEKTGRVSWCAIGMGGVEMTPGKVATFPTREGGKGIFKPGMWTVRFDPESRELSVEIVVENFHLDTRGGNALEGSTSDILVGPVSEDYRVWEADWLSKEVLVSLSPEPKKFSEITEYEFRKKVIFEKEE